MRVVCVGGGPAGLYCALLLKKANPAVDVTVLERNGRGDTFGWGVVFSNQTLDNFRAADAETYAAITEHFAHWDDIDVNVKDVTITSSGHGFSGIARKTLLELLHQRAEELGVQVRFNCDVGSLRELDALGLGDADLIIAADGVNSRIRSAYADAYEPSLDVRPAKYTWLGTTRPFDAFTFYFVKNAWGVFQAHCYRFEPNLSTFIVECDVTSWRNAGFDTADTAQTIAICEELFAPWLDGHPLFSNAKHLDKTPWTGFVRVTNERWFTRTARGVPVVLIGDAAHTAHFSIGSGTKLAMEDAIALAQAITAALRDGIELDTALQQYQDARKLEALRIQNAARNSMEWFEHVKRYMRLEPQQFAYSLLTRSQRVSHENLRVRDTRYLDGVERWFAGQEHVPPMFTPYQMREMKLANRIALAPMDMYRAVDGLPGEFHFVHLGSRAVGGAALIFTEMTCVSPEGRITPGCTGMYCDEHVHAWRRIVDFVHAESPAKICLQLGHAGRKGSTKVPWQGNNQPLDFGNWEVIGPSPIAYGPELPTPREMTRTDMEIVREQFVCATRYAIDAGFDMIELHCAHGYLLSSFITPLSNQRNDEYGGSVQNRMRFPLEVFTAMRREWPQQRPMSVRISATDWAESGITGDDAVQIARMFVDAGADIIHVSTGQTSSMEKPVYGRMFQTPYSDQIRNEAGVPTIAVGNIQDADQINSILAAGRADLCALGRPYLSDPYWTLHAAAGLGYQAQSWPHSYFQGRRQLEREIERQRGGV